jgi:ribosome recycling factor
MPILKKKIRKDGTSEDICKVPKKSKNLTNSYIRKVDELLVHKEQKS